MAMPVYNVAGARTLGFFKRLVKNYLRPHWKETNEKRRTRRERTRANGETSDKAPTDGKRTEEAARSCTTRGDGVEGSPAGKEPTAEHPELGRTGLRRSPTPLKTRWKHLIKWKTMEIPGGFPLRIEKIGWMAWMYH
jgi:hypothetical protein